MKLIQERNNKIIYAISTFLGGTGVGAIIYTLGTIQGLLEIQVTGSRTGYYFNTDSAEEEQSKREETTAVKEPTKDDLEEEKSGFKLDSSGRFTKK